MGEWTGYARALARCGGRYCGSDGGGDGVYGARQRCVRAAGYGSRQYSRIGRLGRPGRRSGCGGGCGCV